MRHWIGGRDVHLEAIEPEQYQGYRIDTVVVVWSNPVHSCDVSVAVRLQIVVPVWVCQLNLKGDFPYGQNIRTRLPTGSTLLLSPELELVFRPTIADTHHEYRR